MKITLASDLHLEFGQTRTMTADADVLILSGDICVSDHFTRGENSPYHKYNMAYLDFFKKCSDSYPHVLYVMGNHEHYHGRFNDTANILKNELSDYCKVLDYEWVDIDGIRFVGTTLWTDVNKQDPVTEMHLRQYMNDYRVVQIHKNGVYRKLNPMDTISEHFASVQFIDDATRNHPNCVVLTHHGPTPLSIGERFKNDYHGNGGYVSDLFDFIYDRPQIKLWTHGHVHHNTIYKVNETTVACNPGAYPGENPQFDQNFILEV
jgi:Icc-related predicted phosphoesterase